MNQKQNDDSSYLDDSLRVSLFHKKELDKIADSQNKQDERLSDAIDSSEKLLLAIGYSLPEALPSVSMSSVTTKNIIPVKSWNDILQEAKQSTPENISFDDLLTQSEIDCVLQRHASIGSDLSWFSSFDRYDFALSIATGFIAGIIDVLLVAIPAHPGFLGSQPSTGGWLSNLIREKTGNLFPKEKIVELEKLYRVSYDFSTSHNLNIKVPGLGPRTHRFQSLGHDPLLGFVFGVKDILSNEFSAIGKDGSLIVQKISQQSFSQGEQLFISLLEAFKIQFGHLASDIATPAGLPAPLMPLLLFLQVGEIGDKKYTIAEISRQMYRSGYDFRHFIAGSIPVIVTEVIIRLGYFVKSIQRGKDLEEAILPASSLKLRRQLLLAHTVATLINTGKVYVTKNPLAISWSQILVFLRYIMPEVSFLLFGKEAARSKLVEDEIINDYKIIENELNEFLKTQDNFLLTI